MFVGYEVKSNQNQAKSLVLEKDINLSQAVLDPSSLKNKNKEPVSLVVEYNKKQHILAVLDPNQSWQCPLNLVFAAGSQVKFFVRGSGTVHLTGYEQLEFDDDIDMSDSDDSDAAEEMNESGKKSSVNGSAKKAALTNGHSKPSPAAKGKKVPSKLNDTDLPSSDESDDEDYANLEEEDMDDSDAEMFESSDDDDGEEDGDSEEDDADSDDDLGMLDEEESDEE